MCILTTQAIMKLLKSKEAAAAVDIKSWPMVLDTGKLDTDVLVFMFSLPPKRIFAFKTLFLCLGSSTRWPPQEEESPDVQAPDSRDVSLPGLQCVHDRNLSRGQSMLNIEGHMSHQSTLLGCSCHVWMLTVRTFYSLLPVEIVNVLYGYCHYTLTKYKKKKFRSGKNSSWRHTVEVSMSETNDQVQGVIFKVALFVTLRVIPSPLDVPRCHQCLVSFHKTAVWALPLPADCHLSGPVLRPGLRSLVPVQVNQQLWRHK